MNKTSNEVNSIDIRDDVETALYSLNEPITLLNLLSNEMDDIYSCITDVKQAKTQADKLAKQQFLSAYVAERIESIVTLNSVATDLIKRNQSAILDLTKQGK